MTNETKKEIAALYADKTNKVHDIADAYHITTAQVAKIAIEMGLPPRRPKAMKENKSRKCPKCHSVIDLKGVKFCPFCGTDMRTERDILIEKLSIAQGVIIRGLPAGDRDDVRDTLNAVVKYLRGLKND